MRERATETKRERQRKRAKGKQEGRNPFWVSETQDRA